MRPKYTSIQSAPILDANWAADVLAMKHITPRKRRVVWQVLMDHQVVALPNGKNTWTTAALARSAIISYLWKLFISLVADPLYDDVVQGLVAVYNDATYDEWHHRMYVASDAEIAFRDLERQGRLQIVSVEL